MPTAVVAVGGNSLIADPKHQTVPDQFAATRETAAHLAEMVQAGWNIVVTHGNGPQVGFILLRSEISAHVLHPVPLDSCGADTQGAIGYMLQQCLQNEFKARGIARQAVTVVTQTLVDRSDPAFQKPSKPIGSFYYEAKAREYMQARQWAMVEDAGRGWRRVVPSPMPLEIVEIEAIRRLLKAGAIVIAAGGGGIPVTRQWDRSLHGVEAVIDKDLASSLLGRMLGFETLVIVTGVERVSLHYGTPQQRDLERATADELEGWMREGHFPPGSMGPKIQAAIEFVRGGGREVIVSTPERIREALAGETGTHVRA